MRELIKLFNSSHPCKSVWFETLFPLKMDPSNITIAKCQDPLAWIPNQGFIITEKRPG